MLLALVKIQIIANFCSYSFRKNLLFLKIVAIPLIRASDSYFLGLVHTSGQFSATAEIRPEDCVNLNRTVYTKS